MRAFLPGLPGQPPAGPPISHTLPLAVVQVRCGLYLLLEVTRPFCAVWMSGGTAPRARACPSCTKTFQGENDLKISTRLFNNFKGVI